MKESSEVLGMVSKKDRCRGGYVTPAATVSRKELLENDLFLQPFYDDWNDYITNEPTIVGNATALFVYGYYSKR